MLSRIIYGARASVSVALAGLVIGGGLGSLLGLLAGFGGRGLDTLVMRIVDAQLAFPSLLLAIAVIAALGTSLWTLLAVLALRSWAVHARTLRSAVLVIREQESVTAARALGAGPMRVAFKEILPNALAPAHRGRDRAARRPDPARVDAELSRDRAPAAGARAGAAC